ncbi:MAG: hypothetical protein M1837_006895 [Sclerophora amabilis]|nr:MAG: hypothetical protein M1837_006895 [Sclerophora amabilis]
MAEVERQPFLSSSDDKTTVQERNLSHTRSSWAKGSYGLSIVVHLVLVTLHTFVAVFVVHANQGKCPNNLNGMQDLNVAYQPKLFTAFQDSSFTGAPGPESDQAWHELLSTMTIRVSREELERTNQTSVELPGGDYMAWLGKMLRQWKYRDYYHPNLTLAEAEHRDLHADHCLEMLRSASLCHVDTSLTTFRWDTQDKPMLDTKRPTHTCVDWHAFTSSLEDRLVGPEEVAKMVNPSAVRV